MEEILRQRHINERYKLIQSLHAAIESWIVDGGWTMVSTRISSAFSVITDKEYAERYETKMHRNLQRNGMEHIHSFKKVWS